MIMFERKNLDPNHLPDHKPSTLRHLSDSDLYQYTAGWQPNTAARIAGEVEIRRRESWPARFAIGISMTSLIIAFASLFVKAG